MARRCLITGATGAIGPAVVRAFRDAGYVVRILARMFVEDAGPSVEVVIGDLRDDSVADAVRGVDVVVHMAALLHIAHPSRDLIPEYDRINVEGTRRLLAAAAPRFVFLSTIAVYGAGEGRLIDESSPPHPATPYAASKLAAEQLVLDSPGGVVLRLASVYGPSVKGNYRRLVRAVRRRTYIPIGRGDNRRTLIHEEDVAQAAVLAANSDVRGVFNVTDGSVHTIAEIVDAIAAASGRKPPPFHLPAAPARVAARVADAIAPFLHAGSMLDKYLEDLAVDGARFQQTFGFAPRYDVRAGWVATIRDSRNRTYT